MVFMSFLIGEAIEQSVQGVEARKATLFTNNSWLSGFACGLTNTK